MSALDRQEGGDHYRRHGYIQPVEFIYRNNLGFIEGNVVKYVSRHWMKDGLADLKKARHYIDLLIEMQYGKEAAGNQEAEPVGQLVESPHVPPAHNEPAVGG